MQLEAIQETPNKMHPCPRQDAQLTTWRLPNENAISITTPLAEVKYLANLNFTF